RLRLAAAHSLTLARLRAEKYFCRRTCRRQKCFELYLRLRAQTLRGFFDSLRGGSVGAASFDMQKLPFHGAFLRKGGF
ncbi:MAG: hypothetical protein ACI3U0_05550, partial [Oscillospiraceae bacterium]